MTAIGSVRGALLGEVWAPAAPGARKAADKRATRKMATRGAGFMTLYSTLRLRTPASGRQTVKIEMNY